MTSKIIFIFKGYPALLVSGEKKSLVIAFILKKKWQRDDVGREKEETIFY